MNSIADLQTVTARVADATAKLNERVTAREAGYVQRIHELESALELSVNQTAELLAENTRLKAERPDLAVLDAVYLSLTATADQLEAL
jgi:hypothetical protein